MPDQITLVVVGHLTDDYFITAANQARLHQPGGSALYAAAGAGVWSKQAGLVARVGSNYDPDWIAAMNKHGIDTEGIMQLTTAAEHRNFYAYLNQTERVRKEPYKHFRRIQHPLPPQLKDYDDIPPQRDLPDEFGPLAVRPDDIPERYMTATGLHIAPCDFVTHRTVPASARTKGTEVITCDPSARYMQPSCKQEVEGIVVGLDAFLPDENEVRKFFRDELDDLWEAAAAFGALGARNVVIKRGVKGQYVYHSETQRKWHIPAYPTQAFDVTGAGDAFCGGFLYGLVETGDSVEAALYGGVSASLAIEGVGAPYALDAHPHLAAARLSALRDLVRPV